jgi:hypothetical protein
MKEMESRLRDAYRGATDTVRPEAIRGLDEQAAVIAHPARGSAPRRTSGRWLVPLTAAAAVVAIGVAAGVVVPHVLSQARDRQASTGSPGAKHGITIPSHDGRVTDRYVVGLDQNTGASLIVASATTGRRVATVDPAGKGQHFGAVTTSNGRIAVAAVWPASGCGSQLALFPLGRGILPREQLTVGAFAHLIVEQVAAVGDGSTVAFYAQECGTFHGGVPAVLGVVNLRTGKTREWRVPGQEDISPISLTSNGRLLEYSVELTKLYPSGIYLLPTDAAPGTAAQRSRELVRARSFGATDNINSAVITPDGTRVYFTTNTTGPAYDGTWTLRSASVATGQVSLVGRYRGFPDYFTANPQVTQVLVADEANPASVVLVLRRGQVRAGLLGFARMVRVDLASGQLASLPRQGWDPAKYTYIW